MGTGLRENLLVAETCYGILEVGTGLRENLLVAETCYGILEVLSRCDQEKA